MRKNLNKISTRGMPRAEWIAHRRKTIGGSDAASIIGLNPYSSAYSVWADKLGKLTSEDNDNEAMRIGRDLESYVAKRFTEATGKKVRRENSIIINPDYPYAHANVDRMIVGEDAGLECKTTSVLNMRKFKNGEYPDAYYVQCVHYMMVTGCSRWYLAVLILGKGFVWFVIERDEAEIAALASSEADFWQLVESETVPLTDGSESTSKMLSVLYPEGVDVTVNLIGFEADIRSYITYKSLIKDAKRQQDEVANRIKAAMGEAAQGETEGFTVTWKNSPRSTFDIEAYRADHLDTDLSKYVKTTNSRIFKIEEKN